MKVTLAYPYVDADGKPHDPDTTVDLPDGVAKGLVHDGLARVPDDKRSVNANKKEG